jgi:uncharacterized protein with ParB-like and HNH nuclease domain
MVLDQRRVYGNAVPVQLVIDGQQRLTTFQVFLSAFRDVCTAEGEEKYAKECDRYLLNDGLMENEKVERFKVWPTHADRTQFTDVVDSGSREQLERRHPIVRRKYQRKPEPRARMVEAYLFFHSRLTEFLKSDEYAQAVPDRVASMHEALRGALQVVTIELEGEDDPQVIFETLNARGEPLLPSDLLRNFIFLRAAQRNENSEKLYQEHWLPFDSEFWRTVEKQGRLVRPRSDIFLQHYLTLKRQQEVLISYLYSEYKEWIKTATPFNTVAEELKELGRHRRFYADLIQRDTTTVVGRFASFLKTFDLSTVYPLILGIMGFEPKEDDLVGMLTDLESYIVRRAVCGLTTKNYNRVFLTVLTKLAKKGFSRDSLRDALAEQQGESVVWPANSEFRSAWLDKSVYEQMGPARTQYVLRELERRIHDARAERIEILSKLTVEHILPDEWIENWPLANGSQGATLFEQFDKTRSEEDIEASQLRDRLKNSFGNLTLLTQPLNSSVSNSAFRVKKPEILRSSALAMNRYFQDVDDWGEVRIRERGARLCDLAKEIWPHPNR